ncbi:MAG TPA: nuclear transport factor 2 family protein [Thermomicrobiales bacterium]|nr:nuclear transport factor 2 family protein [Thermomicrobiales bacterium]
MTASIVQPRQTAVRSPVPLVVACGALLTALALARLGVAATAFQPRPASGTAAAATATRLAVDRFYAAVNVLLATGDPTLLVAAVDPTFVDHVAGSSREWDHRPTIIAGLMTLRRNDPGLQLDVAAVIVDGDQALAYIQAASSEPAGTRPEMTIEALRVRGGLVVERWSDEGRAETSALAPRPSPAPIVEPTAMATNPPPPRFPRTQS